MKKIIVLILAFFVIAYDSQSQFNSLLKVQNLPQSVKMAFSEYFSECIRERYFHEDKGIVEVISYKDSLLKDNYLLSAVIDDRFLENPTNTYYTNDNGEIFIFYDGDKNGNKLKQTISLTSFDELKKLIGDRVYIRPQKTERLIELIDINGNIKKTKVKYLIAGNTWNTTRYIFSDDGKYIISKSL
jgi:hypothetical protein